MNKTSIKNLIIVIVMNILATTFFILLIDSYNISLLNRMVEKVYFSHLSIVKTLNSIKLILFLIMSVSCTLITYQGIKRIYDEFLNKDFLTGAYTRRKLLKDINSNYQKRWIVCYIDLNHFKFYNDTFGHDVGDKILLYFVQMLRSAYLGINLYRIGGDEFVVLIEDDENAQIRINQISDINYLTTNIDNHLIKISFSFGYSYFDKSKDDFNQILKLADDAMYEHKSEWKNEK